MANNQCWPRAAKHKNQALKDDSGNGPTPKKAKTTQCKRGKQGEKGKNGICYNCDKEGHFTRDCTEPKKLLSDFSSCDIYATSYVMITHSHPY